MKALLKYLRDYKKETILAPAFKLLEACFDLIVPLVMARLIDRGIGAGDRGEVFRMGGALVFLGFVGLAVAIVAQFFAARAAVGFAANVRLALFSRIQRFSFTQLDTLGTKTLITRLTSDVNQAQNGVNMVLRLFLRSPFIVVGAMVMAFFVDARAALIFVAVIPVLSLVVYAVMSVSMPLYKTAQERLDRVLLHTRGNLAGTRVIRAFCKEEEEYAAFVDANSALTATQRRVGAISGLLNPATQVVVNIGVVALIWTGALHIETGTLSQGQIIALLNYMSQILVELVKFANLIVTVTRGLASCGRIAQVLAIDPDMEDGEQTPAAEASVGKRPDVAAPGAQEQDVFAVVFDHVSLRYAGAGADALRDVTFTARAGETIGVIGGTGSGKSSLVHLIPRFYDATEGSVRVFGEDVRKLKLSSLREAIGMVFQQAKLFSGSIRDNLRFGRTSDGRDPAAGDARADGADAEDALLRRALEASQSAEFVDEKPGGADFVLTQNARNLSGGQRQRLSIARALMRRPRILILDDAASALDFATDLKLRTEIRRMSGSMTIFIVSQRVPSVRFADKILVLDGGELVGQGTHEELMENCGIYREIYRSQFPEEESA